MALKDCIFIDLPRVGDERGFLTFVENGLHLPFDMQRIYYLYEAPKHAKRGGHAHKALKQLMIPISGSFDVLLDDGTNKKQITLNQPYRGLYICPMIWRELDNFSPNAVCLVVASTGYDESDYLRDYKTFLTVAKGAYESSVS